MEHASRSAKGEVIMDWQIVLVLAVVAFVCYGVGKEVGKDER